MTKNIVITGGNSGIGLETARGLYADGHTIIIGSRNQKKSHEAIQDIIQSRPQSKGAIKYFPMDLSKRETVDKFAEYIKKEFRYLDILINNAGVIRGEEVIHENGVELTYMVNYFGHFYLTYLLFGLLEKAKQARIINVASKFHETASEPLTNDIGTKKGWSSLGTYGRSKLATVMFTISLGVMLANRPNIKSATLHPGLVNSDIYDYTCKMRLFSCCCFCCLVDNKTGARTSLHLSRIPFEQIQSGSYYDEDATVIQPNDISQDKMERQRLWEASEKLYDIKFNI